MAIEIWFTSDTHFGHSKILDYEKEARPFNTIEEMNEQLINNWNDTVRPKDIIWHLGDFAFGRNNIELASRLNGKKRIIMGNHDVYNNSEYLKYFEKLFGVYYWKKCILSHIPVHRENLRSRAFLNVHGHLHSSSVMINLLGDYDPNTNTIFYDTMDMQIKDPNYLNVSCEQHNLRPVNSSVIMDRLREVTK